MLFVFNTYVIHKENLNIADDPPRSYFPDFNGNTTVYINETTPVSTPILEVIAFDPENDTISVDILTNIEVFGMNGTIMMLQEPLDYEKIEFYNIILV